MKNVLIINLGWEQQPLITRLKEEGYRLFGVHNSSDYDSLGFETVKVCDFRDLNTILEFARQVRPDAVVADQCDYSNFAQAVVADSLDLAGPSVANAQVSTNKFVQREAASSHGIDIPCYRLCSTLDEAREAVSEIGYPVILKPVDNRGSFGVNKVSREDALGPAFWDALANSHSRFILVEEFVEGVHITVDGYAFPESGCKSLALATKKLIDNEGRQVAVDIAYPGEISKEEFSKAMEVNEEVTAKLGYQFGMTHSEYMVTADGRIVLIEAANRGGGCFTSEIIVPVASGVDLVGQLIEDAMGGRTDNFQKPLSKPVILKFVTFSPGRVIAIRGLENARARAGVLELRIQVEPGDVIGSVSTDANRHGFVIVADDESPRALAESVLDGIEIEYA